jgi:hypothetical protein
MQKIVEQALNMQKDMTDWQLEQWKLWESHTVQVLDFTRKTVELNGRSMSSAGRAFADGMDSDKPAD